MAEMAVKFCPLNAISQNEKSKDCKTRLDFTALVGFYCEHFKATEQ